MAFKESRTNPHIFAKSLFARKTESQMELNYETKLS